MGCCNSEFHALCDRQWRIIKKVAGLGWSEFVGTKQLMFVPSACIWILSRYKHENKYKQQVQLFQ